MQKSKFIVVVFTSLTLTGCSVASGFQDGFQEGWHFASGDRYYKNGDNKKAEKEFQAVIDIRGRTWEPRVKSLVRLAEIFVEENRNSEADSMFKKALDIYDKNADEKTLKSNFLKVKDFEIIALEQYAKFCRKQGRAAEAKALEAKLQLVGSHSQ